MVVRALGWLGIAQMVAIAGDSTLDPNVRVRRINQLLDRGVLVRTPLHLHAHY